MYRCVSKAGSVWECLDQGKTPGGGSGETGGHLNICVGLQGGWLSFELYSSRYISTNGP
jgi:hypothetical protein